MVKYFPVRIRFLLIAASLVVGATLIFVACGGTSGAPAQSSPTAAATTQPSAATTAVKVQIVEKNGMYAFDPATLMIKKGTQVVWTNASDAPHTVTSNTGAFNTPGDITQNQTFMFTFNTAGTFMYHCNVHPYMKATITVTS